MATQLIPSTKLDFVPLSSAIGVEVRSIDLRNELDANTRTILRTAWTENCIMLVRGQDLSEEEQFVYARVFGEVADRVAPPVEKRPYRADPTNRMQLVTNRIDGHGRPLGSLGDGEMWFHTDKFYIEKPHRASLLYALEIPSVGGHTKFANLYAAYDRLPNALRNKLEGRKVLQLYDYDKNSHANLDQNLEELLHYWHPIFVTNPDTGRKAAYVSRLMSVRIEGFDDDEGRAVIDEIADIIEAPDNIYDHTWLPGDIMIWDNLSSLHARTDWPREELRSLRRVTINGDVLF